MYLWVRVLLLVSLAGAEIANVNSIDIVILDRQMFLVLRLRPHFYAAMRFLTFLFRLFIPLTPSPLCLSSPCLILY